MGDSDTELPRSPANANGAPPDERTQGGRPPADRNVRKRSQGRRLRGSPARAVSRAPDGPLPFVADPGARAFLGIVRGLVSSLRPRQWPKNAVVLAGVLFARELGKPDAVTRAVAGAVLFCLLSSTVYLVNDVLDRDKDRLHPTKRLRPIAAGIVPIPLALGIAAAVGVASLAWSIALEPAFGGAAAAYLALQALYVVVLKHLVILDVLAVAGGFVIRAAAGAFAIGVPVSPWLYVCTMLLALFLALGKRRQEIALLASEAHGHRPVLRGYTLPLVDQLIGIVTTALLVSYMLYTFTADALPANHAMMLTIPFPLYGVFRYLYLIHVRGDGGAPEEVLLRDRPIALVGISWVVACIAILYAGR